ncbi:MAG: branched-chain amino acid transport system II carrier protein, partial [Psychroserpens sp.]|nr:branched-chain amino acid transport system II carrier protein [Psychroserpens sp.]
GSEITIDNELSSDMQRANLLRGISIAALGNFGNTVLSILISLACFTTAVGVIAGTADYFKGLLGDSQKVYVITAIISCMLGVLVGQLDFHSIVVIAIPVLFCLYPITIVLIVLNVLPDHIATPKLFRAVVLVTILFSLPDVIGFIWPTETLTNIVSYIPLAQYSFGWVLPALVVGVSIGLFKRRDA